MMVLVGYDDEEKVVYCADSGFKGVFQRLSLRGLMEARSSRHDPLFPPRIHGSRLLSLKS